jgi:hypothetical protein
MNPRMSLVCHLRQNQQVVTTETVGRGPLFVLPVKAGERGVETNARFGLVFPDCGLDCTEPDLMYWFCVHSFFIAWMFCREIVQFPFLEIMGFLPAPAFAQI